jgi:hypothetical protein
MNANHQTINRDLIQLRSMSDSWGDVFTGTKAQLNAVGFGVGCLFPGEPRANKKSCKLPIAHGYAEVCVHVPCGVKSPPDAPFQELVFYVTAHYLTSDSIRREKRISFAPGVFLQKDWQGETYVGTAQALLLAGLIEERQLPGMPGCGKCTTTFDANGDICSRGRSGLYRPSGSKVVRKYGKKISVFCIASATDQEVGKDRERQKWEAYLVACLDAKCKALALQSAPRQRPALRLVWSA